MTNYNTNFHNHDQRGIAIIAVLMVLMLLTALAVALVYVTNTETGVNANYKREQVLYFAAKGGIEEARDRLMPANASTLIAPPLGTCAPSANCLPATPVVPSGGNSGVLYVLNPGALAAGTVKPWATGTPYTDDELCHDGYNLPGQTPESGDVRCVDEPTGAGWYSTTTSTIPWNGTAAALPYQWVRVSWKLNGSVDNGKYPVSGTPPLTAAAAATPVCWDGSEEILLKGAADCTQMVNLVPPGPPANPVYLLTALAVNPTSGARKMVQAEVALAPAPPFPYGLYATGNGCGALSMGGGATTDSFTTAGGGTYATTATTTGGDVGSNGNVNMVGSPTQVGGSIGVPTPTTGACPAGLTTSGGAGMLPPSSVNKLQAAGPYTFPTPPLPNPLPPTNSVNFNKSGGSLVPGSYGNISVTGGGRLTLAPGIYDINSISLAGNSTLVISPAGAIVFNIAGQGSATPVDFTGGSFSNASGIANNFQINYAGTGNIVMTGSAAAYAIVDAPNAAIKLRGNKTNFYGSIIGNTIDDSGGLSSTLIATRKMGRSRTGTSTRSPSETSRTKELRIF